MRAIIVIPARMGSSRFPGKPTAEILGVSMLERVWRIAKACKEADGVVVATPDAELVSFVEAFGGRAHLTPLPARGAPTDCLDASEGYELVANLQGDAPLTPPWIVDGLLAAMKADATAGIATPMYKMTGDELARFAESKRAGSSTGTTVAFDHRGYAMYFSKSLVPFHRPDSGVEPFAWRHVGLYAYRREALARMIALPQGPFEAAEKLEQLRALENGIPIRMVEADYRGRSHASVDRPEDLKNVEEIIAREGEFPL